MKKLIIIYIISAFVLTSFTGCDKFNEVINGLTHKENEIVQKFNQEVQELKQELKSEKVKTWWNTVWDFEVEDYKWVNTKSITVIAVVFLVINIAYLSAQVYNLKNTTALLERAISNALPREGSTLIKL